MAHHYGNVDDINNISSSSPYLSFSLWLLTCNIVFTFAGVLINKLNEDPLADGVPQKNTATHGISLGVFFIICVSIIVTKYIFVCVTQRPCRRQQCWQLVKTIVFDLVFVVMGMLYLAGDNLPIFHCRGMREARARNDCMEQSSVIVGFSLLLHTALYVAGALKLKPTEIPTFPVTGRIRNAYQNVLQLAVLTIFVDQTFSTVVRFVTHIDIEADETPNCGCVGNTTAANCLALVNKEVGGFSAGLFGIILLIVLGMFVKDWKDYFSCCKQCCHNFCENICIFGSHALVIVFMVLYTLSDNRWLWRCVAMAYPTAGRISMLVIALGLSAIWHALYIFIICLPGVGIVLENGYFSKYEYATFEAGRDNSEWVHKCIFVLADPPDVILHNPTLPNELTESGRIRIEESPIENETTLKSAYKHIIRSFKTTDQSDGGTKCCVRLKNKCKCDKRSVSEYKEIIMLSYLGKENVSTPMLSADNKTLDVSEVAQRYPNVTQFYVVPKANEDPSHRMPASIPTATIEPEDGDGHQQTLEASESSDCARQSGGEPHSDGDIQNSSSVQQARITAL